jgi:hypothetical protein
VARTYDDVITRAREILQDTNNAAYRYSEQSVLNAVNDSILEVQRVRPDILLAVGLEPEDAELTDTTLTLPIDAVFFQSLVYMTAGYMMLRDNEFAVDQRAVNLLNKGLAQLLTVAA